MNLNHLNNCLLSLLLLPTLASATDRIRVFDDEVLQAMQDTTRPLSEWIIDVPSLQDQNIANCNAFVEAGQPPVDGMLPPQVRTCQINALLRVAIPSASSNHSCDVLAALAEGMYVGGFNAGINQRWDLSPGEHTRAAERAELEVLPGCTGLSIAVDGWTTHFILRAIADWNHDSQPDYLLELIEFAHGGSYRASQLLVAVSAGEQQWVVTTPAELLRADPAGRPRAE